MLASWSPKIQPSGTRPGPLKPLTDLGAIYRSEMHQWLLSSTWSRVTFCSTSLPLPSTRWVRSTFSSHCSLFSKQRRWLTSPTLTMFSSKKIRKVRIQTQSIRVRKQVCKPLSYAAPQVKSNFKFSALPDNLALLISGRATKRSRSSPPATTWRISSSWNHFSSRSSSKFWTSCLRTKLTSVSDPIHQHSCCC